MNAIGYVGLAYAAVFLIFFVYVLRLSQTSRRLEKKLAELEREHRTH
jgi:CcmD family protein